jgi:hypothetical protein
LLGRVTAHLFGREDQFSTTCERLNLCLACTFEEINLVKGPGDAFPCAKQTVVAQDHRIIKT